MRFHPYGWAAKAHGNSEPLPEYFESYGDIYANYLPLALRMSLPDKSAGNRGSTLSANHVRIPACGGGFCERCGRPSRWRSP